MSTIRSGDALGPGHTPALMRWGAADASVWLRPPSDIDHKVSRGVLAARIGSARYPGAAVLGVSGAWRTGIGMVRYVPPFEVEVTDFGLPSPAASVLAARPETVFGGGPCDAWLLGSGTSALARSAEETAAIAELHQGAVPLVVDAGALDTALRRDSSSAPAVLTPHFGEFRKLRAATELGPDATIGHLAERLNATILLKGSTSLVASPTGHLISIGPATPWLATAGTGDVLAGMLGALVARHAQAVRASPETLAALAATAALVHDVAARIASGDDSSDPESCSGQPITALDVANAVPSAIRQVNSVISLE